MVGEDCFKNLTGLGGKWLAKAEEWGIITAEKKGGEKIFSSDDVAIGKLIVEMDNAGDGRVRPFRFEALQKGWVKTSRNFARLNDNCASGIPTDATAEKGKKYLDLVCARISQFLIEFARQPIDEYFPHQPDLS